MNFSTVNLEALQGITIRDHCLPEKLSEKYAEIYRELRAIMRKQSLDFASHPFGIYHGFTTEDVDVEAGIPVKGSPFHEGRMNVTMTYSCIAVKLDFYRHYSKLGDGWSAISKYVEDNGLKASAPCFEIYATDPEKEPNPDKWLTEIYFPVF